MLFVLCLLFVFKISYIIFTTIKNNIKSYIYCIEYLKSLDIIDDSYDITPDNIIKQNKQIHYNLKKIFNCKFNTGYLRLFTEIIKYNEREFFILNKIKSLDIIKLLHDSNMNCKDIWTMSNYPNNPNSQKNINKLMKSAVMLTLHDFDESKYSQELLNSLKSIVTYVIQLNDNPSKENLRNIKNEYILGQYKQDIFDGVLNELSISR